MPSARPALAPRRRRGVARRLAVLWAALALGVASVTWWATAAVPAAAQPVTPAHPYPGGGIITFGDAQNFGAPTTSLASPLIGMAATPDGQGYWLVATDGGVFAYGDAPYAGSLGAVQLTGPVVAMAPTPDGQGYWLVALDGGVFAFGDAGFYGSMGGTRLDQPIVAMASTPDGRGYWLVAADGGVFAFGDAGFYGSLGGVHLVSSVTGMAPTPDGQGYWMVAGDGGVFAFGDATYLGSTAGKPIPGAITAMAATSDGKGYWQAGDDGSVYTFGDARNLGGSSYTKPVSPVSAMATTPDGKGYWLLEPDDWDYTFSDPSPSATAKSASVVAIASEQVGPDTNNAQGAYCNPYGPCEPWCSLFVTWVWRQAGVPVPPIPFTGNLYTWAARSTGVRPPTALPAPGDALLFGSGPANTATSVHTGIVAQVWPDGAVVTIEGDAGPAPDGALNTVLNGPFLLKDSAGYNGFAVYAIAKPVR
ncbi:MAG TPA: CHAP domain-containing protein [Acidimicrobiales bacterium]|nr:CHAP domain-containing protein [Acidimicrobiales bacterium]